jgi:hypothetical protein
LSNWKKIIVSGSQAHLASVTASNGVVITGSLVTTGSNKLIGTTQLTGSLFVSGSEDIVGYLGLQPVSDLAIPTDKSASYIYTSGSTNDMYFTQYNGDYTNTVRLRWLEGNIYSGILYGGIVSGSVGGTTFNVSSGSGILVTMNATKNVEPIPVIQYVNWPNFNNQSITNLATQDTTWLTINSSGSLIQSSTAPTDSDFDNSIQIGSLVHPNRTSVSNFRTFTVTSYAIAQQTYEFIRSFGPIKVSGHTLSPSGSSLSINRSSGVAFALGRNYANDPNKPSYVSDNSYNAPTLFRYHKSGSAFVTQIGTNVLDVGYYNTPSTSTGLSAVPGGSYTIQRVFYFPGSVSSIGVYYGRSTYNSIANALQNISFEEFEEIENTLTQAIFLGYIIVKGNTTDLSNTNDAKFLQAGTFRNTTSAGGGGAALQNLDDLADVVVPSASTGDLLYYNSGNWINSKQLVGNYGITGSLQSTSFTGSLQGTASNAISSSYAVTASFASSSPAVYDFGSFATPTDVGGGGNFGIVTDGDKGDITVTSSGSIWTIDNDAVTYAKIQNVTTSSVLLGRATTGAGNIEEIILGSGLTMSGSTLSAAGGGAGMQVQIDTITTSSTWTPPAWGKYFKVYLVGGGGGAGSGARQATTSTRYGGGGGAPASSVWVELNNTQVTGSVSVTIGAGGAGGTSITTDNTNGNNGSPGGATSFGSFTSTYTSGGGNGGTTSSGNRGAAISVISNFAPSSTLGGQNGSNGSPGTVSGVSNQSLSYTGNFGGAGGAGAAGSSTTTANGGTIDYWSVILPSVSVSTGGTNGGNGNDGVSFTYSYLTVGTPGGGGSYKTGQATGRGGDGSYGAGGGGGAASDNGYASGRGGNGGNGICIIVSIG